MKINKRSNSNSLARRGLVRRLLFVEVIFTLLVLAVSGTYAGSATWNLNPTNGNWNTAANWTPATVPNGPADTATFETSNTTDVSLSATTEFHDNSTAGNGSLTNIGGGYLGGKVEFYDSSNAGTATLTTGGEESGGSSIQFDDTSSAANGTFTANAAPSDGLYGGFVVFFNSSTADHGTFVINGATAPGYAGAGGQLEFEDTSTASNATLIVNAATVAGGDGGEIKFVGSSAADNATIIINSGEGVGGDCAFGDNAVGGTARIEVFGNGTLTNSQGSGQPVTVAANGGREQ